MTSVITDSIFAAPTPSWMWTINTVPRTDPTNLKLLNPLPITMLPALVSPTYYLSFRVFNIEQKRRPISALVQTSVPRPTP
jgi:hypothetical protein